MNVIPTVINKMVIRLSFEKFLSKTPPNAPIIPSIMAVIPIFLLIKKSNNNPNKIPNGIPNRFPANRPISNMKITNKLGLIPCNCKPIKEIDLQKI